MKIIISPAKKIHKDADMEIGFVPEFLDESSTLYEHLYKKSYKDLRKLWACNDKIASDAYSDLKEYDLERGQLPALLAYNGIQYKYMAPEVFTDEEWTYVDNHLRVLSAFYGVVRPRDGIIPYRLEMQADLKDKSFKNLYDFWGDKIYKSLYKDNDLVINLASKEYSKAIEPYLKEKDRFIQVTFGVEVNGKVRTKATWAKMARGEMVRYMAEHQIDNPEGMKEFTGLDYFYDPVKSSQDHFVFIRELT